MPGQRDCITRTVKLTGATTVNTTLTQDVATAAIPTTALAISTALSVGIDPTNFASVDAFFKAHCPQLLRAGVTTKGYMNTYRAPATGDGGNAGSSTAPNSACVRELTAGSITDWMIADQSVQVEEQNVHTDIAYSVITDPQTGATEYHWEHLTVKILATNASTGTYTELQDTSYTPPETAPAGLAQAIYGGVSQLHYDGTIELLGYDPAVGVGIGNTIHLTGSRPEWASMAALVQKVSLSVDDGRASIRVGWPKQLMPADLMSIWRANRTRKPVDDAGARNTGLSGNGTGDQTQALGKVHKAPAAGAGGHIPPSTFTALLSPAGAVPVVTDMQAAVNTIYPLTSALAADRFPKSGDKILFYKSGQTPCMIGEVTCQDPRGPFATDTLFNFAFEANGVSGTWFIHAVQVGAYQP